MEILLDTGSMGDYRKFLKIKSLPTFRFVGKTAIFPDKYAGEITGETVTTSDTEYEPKPFLFDYQSAIAKMAIENRKFAVFADCGLGKTLIFAEFARHVDSCIEEGKAILIVSPLMVIQQTLDEIARWYGGELQVEQVRAKDLADWTQSGSRIGITNFEALGAHVGQGRLGCVIVDESSMLKSHYGKWGQEILRLGRGLDWKLAGTGTPAPNDRIEYANHAVFLDAAPNVNAFLAKYFVNRGERKERWVLKPHAIGPFYRGLSAWSIFLTNPATYGWKDHSEDIPPIHAHIENVPMTADQTTAIQQHTGQLLATHAGGIGTRSMLGQISKGKYKGEDIETRKPAYIRELVESWPKEQTIIWCLYNAEQKRIAQEFPDAANITGDTPMDVRVGLISRFKAGEIRVLITKPKILGFGLNLQCATRQVFSGLQDSYEQYYQAVKRSNRVGSTRPLNVHIPVTDAEYPMVETVLEKASRVQVDSEEQERVFNEHAFTHG
jgi:superfamily II DNA or RNA helicase